MECPICFKCIHASWGRIMSSGLTSVDHLYQFYVMKCPACHNDLLQYVDENQNKGFLLPLTQKRKPLPDFIPKEYVKLYEESYSVLQLSPRASAALSRTCLQLLLREYGKVRQGKLFDEIQQVIDSKELPVELEQTIDIIRQNGNNASHPNKNENPGEIISVDGDEAKWGLEILDSLFEHYIIRPHIQNEKLEEFNKKHQK